MKAQARDYGQALQPGGKNSYLMHIRVILLAGIMLIAASCKEDDSTNEVIFMATLDGASEVPANGSTATGTAVLTFNTVTKVFDITVTYTGVTAIGAHIHKGAMGAGGGVVFGFPAPLTSPVYYMSPSLTTAQEADLNANLYYVNIHSTAFPDGEIRGQLIMQ